MMRVLDVILGLALWDDDAECYYHGVILASS